MTDFRPSESNEPATQIEQIEDTYVVHTDFDEQDLTVTIAVALSEIGDCSPIELIPRFSEHADPDALNRLFRPGPGGERREGGPLHLTIEGYDITIFNTGRIEIKP